jgi:formylglycine-generating enzyme required for sulfatase activity
MNNDNTGRKPATRIVGHMNNDDYSSRVLRGGSWYDDPRLARVANRSGDDPSLRYDDLGFRLSRLVNNLEQLSKVYHEEQR